MATAPRTDRDLANDSYNFGKALGERAVLKVLMARFSQLDPTFTPRFVHDAAMAYVDRILVEPDDAYSLESRDGAVAAIELLTTGG